MAAKADPQLMRDVNRALVLDALRRVECASRTTLAGETGLTRATVSAIVEDLLRKEAIRQVGLGRAGSNGGRRPELLEFNAEAVAFLGVCIGAEGLRLAVADGRGELAATHQEPRTWKSPKQAVSHLSRLADRTLQSAGVAAERVRAAGIAVPGLVEHASGTLLYSANLSWRRVPLRDLCEQALRVPVSVSNTTQLSALAELRLGSAAGQPSFILLYVGRGVGAGIVLNGELHYGSQGFSGELGHCTVVEGGPRCACGRRGCLETVASGPAIAAEALRRIRAGAGSRLTEPRGQLHPSTVARAAAEGDGLARQVIAEAARLLGRAVSYLVNALDVRLVIVDGQLRQAGEELLKPLRDSLHEHILFHDQVSVVSSAVEQADLRGAVQAAMELADVAPRLAEGRPPTRPSRELLPVRLNQ